MLSLLGTAFLTSVSRFCHFLAVAPRKERRHCVPHHKPRPTRLEADAKVWFHSSAVPIHLSAVVGNKPFRAGTFVRSLSASR